MPDVSEETQLQIINKLQADGVSSVKDLKYVEQVDIKDLLPVILQRK